MSNRTSCPFSVVGALMETSGEGTMIGKVSGTLLAVTFNKIVVYLGDAERKRTKSHR